MTDQSDERPQPAGVTPPAPAAAAPPAAPSAETLKAAFKAYKKRLKLTQLDDASRIRRDDGAGGHSSIAGITPPDQYPKAVWEALADQGKLRLAGHGTYALGNELARWSCHGKRKRLRRSLPFSRRINPPPDKQRRHQQCRITTAHSMPRTAKHATASSMISDKMHSFTAICTRAGDGSAMAAAGRRRMSTPNNSHSTYHRVPRSKAYRGAHRPRPGRRQPRTDTTRSSASPAAITMVRRRQHQRAGSSRLGPREPGNARDVQPHAGRHEPVDRMPRAGGGARTQQDIQRPATSHHQRREWCALENAVVSHHGHGQHRCHDPATCMPRERAGGPTQCHAAPPTSHRRRAARVAEGRGPRVSARGAFLRDR